MKDVLVNGEQKQTISVYDRALHYGDGLFETMVVINGKVRLWELHWNRLTHGSQRLKITLPDKEKIENEISSLCENETQQVIKLIVTRGQGKRGYQFPDKQNESYILISYPWITYPDNYTLTGVAVRYCETQLSENKLLAGIKHLNRLEQVMARNEWQSNDYQEGLMLTAKGNVVDGTMSNLFAVKNNVLFTPDLSLCGVAGVMRAEVINQAQKIDLDVQIKDITSTELEKMDEVFLTNSLFGVWPVRQLA